MTTTLRRTGTAIAIASLSLSLSCASQKSGLQQRPPAHGRIADSPPEKLAAMPAPDPAVDPDNQNQHFGIEAAGQRRETAKRSQVDRRQCLDVVTPEQAKKGIVPCPPPQQ